jgi:uncharacterized protein (DUF2461 family)
MHFFFLKEMQIHRKVIVFQERRHAFANELLNPTQKQSLLDLIYDLAPLK